MLKELKALSRMDFRKVFHYKFGTGKSFYSCKNTTIEVIYGINTVLIFMTDNGSVASSVYNAGMKGGKTSVNEGGSRVPFYIRWPGKINAGKLIDKPYTTCDFPNTILGMMNQNQLENVHGINDAEMFLNDEPQSSERIIYMTDSPFSEWTAATDGRYKLVLSCKDTPWLFDLEKDPNSTPTSLAPSTSRKLGAWYPSKVILE